MYPHSSQLPLKHMICFLLVVFICSFVFAYQYIEKSNYCLGASNNVPPPFTTSYLVENSGYGNDIIQKLADYAILNEKVSDETENFKKSYHGTGNRFWKAANFDGCCLPNTIIIGAKKAGTRALINFLDMHPEVAVARNEVHFFDREENYSLGLKWYAKRVKPKQGAKALIEKSPFYFIDKETPEKVVAYNSSIRLILLVRDPVNRILSDQTQLYYNSGKTTPNLVQKLYPDNRSDIDQTANILQPSLYAKYLRRWITVFPRTQIHIVDGDKLTQANPYYEMKLLEKFLRLSSFYSPEKFVVEKTKGFYCPVQPNGTLKCLSSSKGRQHLEFDQKLLNQLKLFFAPLNKDFARLVGQDFSWS